MRKPLKRFYGGQRLEPPRRRRNTSSISCSIRAAVALGVVAEVRLARAEGEAVVAHRLLLDPAAVVKLLRNIP